MYGYVGWDVSGDGVSVGLDGWVGVSSAVASSEAHSVYEVSMYLVVSSGVSDADKVAYGVG